jgi:hypothetical protein
MTRNRTTGRGWCEVLRATIRRDWSGPGSSCWPTLVKHYLALSPLSATPIHPSSAGAKIHLVACGFNALLTPLRPLEATARTVDTQPSVADRHLTPHWLAALQELQPLPLWSSLVFLDPQGSTGFHRPVASLATTTSTWIPPFASAHRVAYLNLLALFR